MHNSAPSTRKSSARLAGAPEPEGAQILVINVHSSQNAGDAALLGMTLRLLGTAFPGSSITVAMNLPDAGLPGPGLDPEVPAPPADTRIVPSFMAHLGYGAKQRRLGQRLWAGIQLLTAILASTLAWRRRREVPDWVQAGLRELLAAYAQADLVVSCPGNIFASRSRLGLPFLLSALTVAYASLLRKPLYILPQSIGPFTVGWQRLLVRRVYSRARIVQAREPVSLRLAAQIGIPAARLRLVPDLALALPAAPLEEIESASLRVGIARVPPMLGVTAINRLLSRHGDAVWDRYETAMAGALGAFLQRHGGGVIFFPQVTGPTEREDDRVAARRILEKMGSPSHARLVDEPLPPALLKGLYGQMDLFLATRLHSGIFAASMGVPTLLVEYLTKTRGMAEMMGLEEWRLELVEISEDLLSTKLEALWQQRDAVRQHLRRALPPLEQQAILAGRIIAEDFYGR
jgi:colanic acid/amylovoran biosynthesis protein